MLFFQFNEYIFVAKIKNFVQVFHFSIHKIKNVSPFTNQIVIIFIPIHPTTHQETSSPGVVYTCVTLQQRNDITQLTRPNNRHNRLRHLEIFELTFESTSFQSNVLRFVRNRLHRIHIIRAVSTHATCFKFLVVEHFFTPNTMQIPTEIVFANGKRPSY